MYILRSLCFTVECCNFLSLPLRNEWREISHAHTHTHTHHTYVVVVRMYVHVGTCGHTHRHTHADSIPARSLRPPTRPPASSSSPAPRRRRNFGPEKREGGIRAPSSRTEGNEVNEMEETGRLARRERDATQSDAAPPRLQIPTRELRLCSFPPG